MESWWCLQRENEWMEISSSRKAWPPQPGASLQTPPSLSETKGNLPVIIISVTSVVSVTVVLFVWPLAGEIIWSVVPRAPVRLSTRSPIPIVVVLVPVLLVLVMPLPTPHLVAVATVVELSIPLPFSSVCNEESTSKCLSYFSLSPLLC